MAATRYATYLRRREERLRREEDQREHNRRERELRARFREHVLGIHEALVLEQAAHDALQLGQTQPH